MIVILFFLFFYHFTDIKTKYDTWTPLKISDSTHG